MVETWNGSGRLGENTGRSATESCEDICTITYRLTVYDTNGQEKSATKTIEIIDSREITAVADLVLPSYTFEGHKTPAQDQSTFEVDGVNYFCGAGVCGKDRPGTASRKTPLMGTVSRLTSTQANVTFSKSGTYSVTLTVTPVSGGKATDTEPIEVKKTPYIIDSLSGYQKQNREQILTAIVATTPGKPITDYTITLKDRKTGGTITLTPDKLQENNATIKTRTVEMTEDDAEEYTYITVEFLTKTPAYASTGTNTQDFYYEIDVEDSKGDTDTASKTFSVEPDIPPIAAISLDSAFLRDEGSNTASITAEDVTVASDGDSVSRTWYYGATTAPSVYTDISTMAGYSKLSFGTDKIVGF